MLERRSESNVFRPDNPEQVSAEPPPARWAGELAAGTNMVVRLIDGVDSDVNRVGQTFAASIDEPVMVNGETVDLFGNGASGLEAFLSTNKFGSEGAGRAGDKTAS